MTQTGFVRISSNERFVPDARSPREALALLEKMTGLPDHIFWEDSVSLVSSRFVARDRLVGHRQVGDAHLLALALGRRGRLATFDRGVRDIVPASVAKERAVCVIAVE